MCNIIKNNFLLACSKLELEIMGGDVGDISPQTFFFFIIPIMNNNCEIPTNVFFFFL